MFRRMIQTLVGGALGLTALYVVAKVAYDAGHDMAQEEMRYEQMTQKKRESVDADEPDEPEADEEEQYEREQSAYKWRMKQAVNKMNLLMSFRKLFKTRGGSIFGDIVNDPEDHKLEAYIHEGEVHINIKKRRAITV